MHRPEGVSADEIFCDRCGETFANCTCRAPSDRTIAPDAYGRSKSMDKRLEAQGVPRPALPADDGLCPHGIMLGQWCSKCGKWTKRIEAALPAEVEQAMERLHILAGGGCQIDSQTIQDIKALLAHLRSQQRDRIAPTASGDPTEEDLKAWAEPGFAAWYSKYAHWDSKEEAYEAFIAALRSQPAPQERRHGVDCEKKPHGAGGFLHLPEYEGPYDVDGVIYCGRCHSWMDMPAPPAPALSEEQVGLARLEGAMEEAYRWHDANCNPQRRKKTLFQCCRRVKQLEELLAALRSAAAGERKGEKK